MSLLHEVPMRFEDSSGNAHNKAAVAIQVCSFIKFFTPVISAAFYFLKKNLNPKALLNSNQLAVFSVGSYRFNCRCTLCTYTTKRSMSLRGHILMHNEENIDATQFRVRRIRLANGKTIGLKKGAGLNRHYVCLQCPYVSRYITALWLHFRLFFR